MSNQKNILILTSQTGGGHISLAEALRDLLESGMQAEDSKNIKNPTITIVDPQPAFFHLHYRMVSRYALSLWAAEFRFLDTPGRALLAHRLFTQLVCQRLNTLLDQVQPDLIITTYPFLSFEIRHTSKPLLPASHLTACILSVGPCALNSSALTFRTRRGEEKH